MPVVPESKPTPISTKSSRIDSLNSAIEKPFLVIFYTHLGEFVFTKCKLLTKEVKF